MSLSERLRLAALERARQSGHRVDDYVLEPSGVIDLREMGRATPEVATPAPLPQLDRSADVEGLYQRPLADRRLWRRLRAPAAPAEPTIGEGREPVVIDLTDDDVEAGDEIDLTEPAHGVFERCAACGAITERNFVNLFTRVEYFSCEDCGHMWQQPRG